MPKEDILHLDWETRSTVDLTKTGIYIYAQHPITDILVGVWAFNDNPPNIWTPALPPPAQVVDHINQCGGRVVAHNATFEIAINNFIAVKRYDWPKIKPEQCYCTAAMARAMGLPGGLGAAAAAVGLAIQKDQKGHRLMLQMCKPRKIHPNGELEWWNDEERLNRLAQYCKQDVIVERELFKRLLKLSPFEQKIWLLDMRINARGVAIDIPLIKKAIIIVEKEQTKLDNQIRRKTKGQVDKCSNVLQLNTWINAQAVFCASVAKAEIVEMLVDETIPDCVKEVLRIRQRSAHTSTAKLGKMLLCASKDGRVRDILMYHAAITGRWGGRRVQPQNLPRQTLPPKDINNIIKLISASRPDLIDILYTPPLDGVAQTLRSMFIAGPGKKFIAVDFKAIEARVLAWLAGEARVLDMFRAGQDPYRYAAAQIYNCLEEQITDYQRFVGKVAVLALGYGGGWKAFAAMAKAYEVDIPKTTAEEIKIAWRKNNPNIVNYWYRLEEKAIEAVKKPGSLQSARKIQFRKVGSFLFCRLPSGRVMVYPYPKIQMVETPWGSMKEALTYKGVDSFSHKWGEITTWGGKIAENITQAIARDLLAYAMLTFEMEEQNLKIVMHVHDELLIEVDEDSAITPTTIEHLINNPPCWALDCPLASKAWEGQRYRK